VFIIIFWVAWQCHFKFFSTFNKSFKALYLCNAHAPIYPSPKLPYGNIITFCCCHQTYFLINQQVDYHSKLLRCCIKAHFFIVVHQKLHFNVGRAFSFNNNCRFQFILIILKFKNCWL
jgi:hypothetical protein